MTTEKFLQNLLTHPESISVETVQALSVPVSKQRQAFNTAASAYKSDLDTRRSNLKSQAMALHEEISKLSAERKKLAASVTDYSSRGDLESAAETDKQLEIMERELNAHQRKARLADSATLKGDSTLYNAVHEAYNNFANACAEQRAAIDKLRNICKQQEEHFRNLSEKLKYSEENSYHEGNILASIEDEFTGGPARRAAEAEKARQEREQKKNQRTCYVCAP